MIQAREGLHFIVRGVHGRLNGSGKDGMVYVTPVADPNALIPGWDGEMLPVPFGLAQRVGRIRKENRPPDGEERRSESRHLLRKSLADEQDRAKRLVEEHANHRKTGAPVPTDDRIVVEAFDRFPDRPCVVRRSRERHPRDLIEELLARKLMIRSGGPTPTASCTS